MGVVPTDNRPVVVQPVTKVNGLALNFALKIGVIVNTTDAGVFGVATVKLNVPVVPGVEVTVGPADKCPAGLAVTVNEVI